MTYVPPLLCGISPPFGRLFPTKGQITHVLLTRAPLYSSRRTFPFDLHVLSTPPAFVLSQDQTLQIFYIRSFELAFYACFSIEIEKDSIHQALHLFSFQRPNVSNP